MSLQGEHVVVAGAGIIGLTIALELADAGAAVTVCERASAMRAASWAAAGMLAVDDPENDPALLPLARLSRELYPALLGRLQRMSGVPLRLRTRRTLQAVHGRQQTVDASAAMPTEEVPELAPGAWSFLTLDEASLDPRDLCRALPEAVRAAGITLLEHTAVQRARQDASLVQIETLGASGGVVALPADALVIAAGAWSSQIEAPFALPPVRPSKGQVIEVTLPQGSPGLTAVLRTPEVYLVPRELRRIVVGATVEDAGFDIACDAEAAAALLSSATALWPPLRHGAVTAHWSGLRPARAGGAQGLPCIGRLGGADSRLWTATGHYRNGILLAPGTARLLRCLMNGDPAPVPADAFLPGPRM